MAILEVPGAPAALLHPKVLLQVVDDKDIDIFEAQGERVFTIGRLVAQPGGIRDELPAARAHAVLVDHRHRGVQADVLEPHLDLGRRLADLDRLRVALVALDRDVQPVRAGREPVDVQRRGAEELAIEEHRRTRHVAADAQDAGGAGWRRRVPRARLVHAPAAGRSVAAGASRAIGPAPAQAAARGRAGARARGSSPQGLAAAAGRARTRRRRRQTAAPSTITSSISPRREVGGGSSSNTLMRARVTAVPASAALPPPVSRPACGATRWQVVDAKGNV